MNLRKELCRLARRSSRGHRWTGSSSRQGGARRLTFSPQAWLKLLCFLHAGESEVGGFGISAPHDPLYVEGFVTVAQDATQVRVVFDDAAVADYFEQCVDRGLKPDRFARIWCHTHPDCSPQPSLTDEETFGRVFGRCDWSVMFILSRTHRTYARLNIAVGPGAQVPLEVAVDWEAWPRAVFESNAWTGHEGVFDAWINECRRNIRPCPPDPTTAEVALAKWEQEAWELERAALDLPPGGIGIARPTDP